MLLQGSSALPISLSLPDGPLRTGTAELIVTLGLAPLAVVLFCWALWSARKDSEGQWLITTGPYAWLRHPMYFAFLAMLIATGLLVSARVALGIATVLYVVGSELRIAAEETDLASRFPADYAEYRRTTKWRYLPGLR
jgi:protein-S-isoprenylcysteine O-methyltransferase Ste14